MFQSIQKYKIEDSTEDIFQKWQKKISGTIEVLDKFWKFDNFSKCNCFDFLSKCFGNCC